MDLTGMRSLFTCKGCNEVEFCCREELWKKRIREDLALSVCESPPNAQTIFLSLMSLTFHLFP